MAPVAADPTPVAARPTLGRITDRTTFLRLRRDGARASRHGVSVTWVAPRTGHPDHPERPRVAFVVSRQVGGAVVRNRVRRRLRAGLRELAVRADLPPGDYLVGARADAAHRPWPELVDGLAAAVASATSSATRGAR